VRERGYALEKEEAVLGEGGVAAPIFDRSSQAVGAIGVVIRRERLANQLIRHGSKDYAWLEEQ
jgi:DNA-binding IclR family transcriptional regulator